MGSQMLDTHVIEPTRPSLCSNCQKPPSQAPARWGRPWREIPDLVLFVREFFDDTPWTCFFVLKVFSGYLFLMLPSLSTSVCVRVIFFGFFFFGLHMSFYLPVVNEGCLSFRAYQGSSRDVFVGDFTPHELLKNPKQHQKLNPLAQRPPNKHGLPSFVAGRC